MVEQLERLYRVHEAAEFLRANPASVYRWIQRGMLPARRASNYLVLTEEDLRSFLQPVTPSHPKQ